MTVTVTGWTGKVDCVTAFGGGTVKLNSTSAERASSSVVNCSGIAGESFATEAFLRKNPETPD